MATDQTTVHIETEIDTAGGWEFGVRIEQAGRSARTLTLRMSWADFEHWSGGASPPSTVAKSVVELAIKRKPSQSALGDFDAAMLRRWFPGADEALMRILQRAD